jgi:hypothetical protein
MKKHVSKFLILLFIIVTAFVSCSKDESSNDEPIVLEGGEIFRSKIITIDLSGIPLSEIEYHGVLGEKDVVLTKSEEGILLFLVPNSMELGLKDLVIPSLNNTTIKYDIKDTVLVETPEATMSSFFTNMNAFTLTLDSSQESVDVQNSLNSFSNYFDSATNEEKIEMAILYKANKVLFDKILLYDFNDVTGKTITASDVILLAKHSLACILAAGGAVAVVVGDPATKVFGAAVAIVAFKKAKQFHGQLADRSLNTVGLVFNSIIGDNDKNSDQGKNPSILFQDEVFRTISFNSSNRKLITSDSNKTEVGAVSYFVDYNRYNYYANKVNVVIQWINNNIPFVTLSLVPNEQLPISAVAENEIVNQETYNNIQLSINHPNLQLVSKSIESSGVLKIKIKIIGTPSSLPIESFLFYSYVDKFSSFTGKVPIKVDNTISLIGTWTLESFSDGVPVGQYETMYSTQCPSISIQNFRFNSETVVFDTSTYTQNSSTQYVFFNKAINTTNCTVISDDPDTQQSYNDSTNGTYVLNGSNLDFVSSDGDSDSLPIIFITNDKIKFGGSVYNRQ